MTSVLLDLPLDPVATLRRSTAHRLAPLLALEAACVTRWTPRLDLERAATRLRTRRPAFDPLAVVGTPDDLTTPFIAATKALERAGLASNTDAAAARAHAGDGLLMIAAWLSGDLSPRDAARATARNAAILVARARLRSTVEVLRSALSLDTWAGRRCPCCGGHPEFAIVGSPGRALTCARCDASWTLARSGCTGCGADAAPTVVRVSLPDDAGYRLAVCNACGLYVKEGAAEITGPMLVERALSAHLDRAAEARGLRL